MSPESLIDARIVLGFSWLAIFWTIWIIVVAGTPDPRSLPRQTMSVVISITAVGLFICLGFPTLWSATLFLAALAGWLIAEYLRIRISYWTQRKLVRIAWGIVIFGFILSIGTAASYANLVWWQAPIILALVAQGLSLIKPMDDFVYGHMRQTWQMKLGTVLYMTVPPLVLCLTLLYVFTR